MGFSHKNKNIKEGKIGSRLLAKDGKGWKNVTMYFAICLFPMIFFHSLVLSLAISRGVFSSSHFSRSSLRTGVCCILYGKVCIRDMVVCGVADGWILEMRAMLFFLSGV